MLCIRIPSFRQARQYGGPVKQERHGDGRLVFRALNMEPDARSLPPGTSPDWRATMAPSVIEIADEVALSAFAGPNAVNRLERAVFNGGVLICITFSGLQGSRIGRCEFDFAGSESCVALVSPEPIEVTSIATSEPTRRTVAAHLSAGALERFGVTPFARPGDRQERVHQSPVTAAARALAHDVLRPKSGPQARQLRAEALVLELLAGLADQDDQGHGHELGPPAARGRRRHAVHRARDLIAACPAANHTLASIAGAAGLSVSSLKRDFQEAFDITPIGFLRERRLQLGRALIERDGHSVSSAAYACGYDHPGNFAQAFRRRFGFAPSRLRR